MFKTFAALCCVALMGCESSGAAGPRGELGPQGLHDFHDGYGAVFHGDARVFRLRALLID